MSITDQPLVFVDTETTGLKPAECRVIEVAAIRVVNGKITDTLVSFIDPQCDIPDFIKELTGINPGMLADAPLFADIEPRLTDVMQGALFIAHNAAFDKSFLVEEYKRIGKTFEPQTACTVQLSREFYPEMTRHKLADVIAHHKIEAVERHRAYDDAMVVKEYFEKMLNQFGEMTLLDMIEKQTEVSVWQ